jgi:uncharacterized membrane protein
MAWATVPAMVMVMVMAMVMLMVMVMVMVMSAWVMGTGARHCLGAAHLRQNRRAAGSSWARARSVRQSD